MTRLPIEDYQQALDFLHGRINYERMSGPLASDDFKLDRMRNLLKHLGDPHLETPVVHVAGTKGKGTTATVVSEILQAAGYRVGLFTSPHLVHYEERLRVNSSAIDRADLVLLTNQIAMAVEIIDAENERLRPTFFEVTTALAWLNFQRQKVDIGVLEVGLGGRLDSTNLCQPQVCVITTISKDHTEVLGDKIAQIAAEKAGIIKPGVPIVCGVIGDEARDQIHEIAKKNSAPISQIDRDFSVDVTKSTLTETELSYADVSDINQIASRAARPLRVSLPLVGRHQAHNAACAIAAIRQLTKLGWRISDEAIQDGCARTSWPARIEVLNHEPLVVLDAAHNPASVEALLKTLDEHQVSGTRTLIYSSTKDKPVEQLLRMLLPQFDAAIVTEFQSNPRAMKIEELSRISRDLDLCPIQAIEQPLDAWKAAFGESDPNDSICVAGSFFLAADLRPALLDQFQRNSDKQS
jgi:dihydrofolate synthase / folylpolyglutamate synthase